MYKDLMLNRDRIEETLGVYANENYKSFNIAKEVKNTTLTRYLLKLDDNVFFIDFYFNKKGGTTIQTSNGKHTKEKEKIAEFVSNNPNCLLAEKSDSNRSMIYKKIGKEDCYKVIDILKHESDELIKRVVTDDEDNSKRIVKFEGQWDDTITVTYFISTNNVRLQGRPLLLFNEISSIFNELIDIDDVIETLKSNYEGVVQVETVEDKFRRYLPNSHDKHSEKLKKSLLKAVFNLNLEEQEYTCTEIVFEALRALEGHIKLTFFYDYDIKAPNVYGTLQMFKFDKKKKNYCLREPERSIVSDIIKVDYYEKAYKYLKANRHEAFHWDYPEIAGVDETVQIENINDAKQIIEDALTMIDEYYC